MEVGISGPVDGVSLLLKGLKVESSPAANEGILSLYSELKEAVEAQERTVPAEYAGDHDEDVKQACKQASLFFVARVMYSSRLDGGKQPNNFGCSISRIAAAGGINLLDFFREVNVVVSKLSPYFEARGSSSKLFVQQAQLKENSEMVVVMGLLAKKYKDNFNIFLHQLEFYKQTVLRLGWSAFLVLRMKLLNAYPDVVSCVELLPCIFAILACHAPQLPTCLSHVTKENRIPLVLKTMSEVCKADHVRVQARMASVQALLTQILTTAVPEWRTAVAAAKQEAPQSDGVPAGPLDLIASPVLEGLVTDSERMNKAVAALEQEYEQHYTRGAFELDEREFLSTDFTKFASPRFSPGQMHSVVAKMRGTSVPLRSGALLGPGAHITAPSHSPVSHMPMLMRADLPLGLHSPLPMMHLGPCGPQPGTPVSEVMGASAWLRGMTASLAAEPSAVLQRYLAAVPVPPSAPSLGPSGAAQSASQQLSRRVRDLVAAVIPEETVPSLLGPFPLLQPSLTSERRTEAIKLYYHSLENILVAEEKASGMTGVTALLPSTKFHRGLIACCVEVVAACYRMVVCAFPKVLDALRIKAFDLAKMIQSFVKSVANLPRELKRHLFLIEEKILESLAWEPGSSLYHLIVNVHSEQQAAVPAKAAAPPREAGEPATSSGTSSVDNSSMVVAGSKSGDDPGTTASDGGEAQQPGGEPRSTPMEVDGSAVPAAAAAGGPAATAGVPASAPPPSPKRGQVSAFCGLMSPAKKARGGDGSAHTTQTLNGPLPQCLGPLAAGAVQPGSSSGALYEFCRKVLKLSAFRLALMCENFNFSPLDRAEVNSKVYETIEHALYMQTHLFYNRHIDQIMLSALYGFCKVHKLAQVSFREIITQYRKQPQAQQTIFRSVVIEQSNPGLQITARADIIAFYNQVFVPAMKAFLLKAEPGGVPASGPGADTKPGLPGHSMASDAASAGARLPPLPPRSASISPLAPKVPPISPVMPRSLARAPSLGPVEPAESSKDGEGFKGTHMDCVVKAEDVPLASTSSTVPSAAACDDGKSMMSITAGSRHLSMSCAPASSAAGSSSRGSGPRTRSIAANEHTIPPSLAVLLQALDSQQGVEDTGEKNARDGGRSTQQAPSGPVTRSGRATAAAGGEVRVSGKDRTAGASTGRERRSARHHDYHDDMCDVDGLMTGDNSEPSSPTGIVAGRRNRTPNRRYGVD